MKTPSASSYLRRTPAPLFTFPLGADPGISVEVFDSNSDPSLDPSCLISTVALQYDLGTITVIQNIVHNFDSSSMHVAIGHTNPLLSTPGIPTTT